MRAVIVVVLTVLLAGWLTASSIRPPPPRGADAPAATFSAMRARVDLDWLAATAHPIGSPALQHVRERLVERLRGLGLEVSTQPAFAVDGNRRGDGADVVAANLENVVAVLPGRDRTAPVLVLMAHIDSVANSPGAADDGIGVVSLIEAARALKAGAEPLRDIVFLFTDGEEVGLLGARAFFDLHPLAARTGALINLEARGSSGRVSMFETGPGNAEMIALYARVAELPNASSLTGFAYRHMPNNTDFSVALPRRIPGLNFAILDNQFDYHAASATPANLDLGSLQQMGDQVLAAGRELAFAPVLPGAGADAVYADVYGRWLIHYPAWVGWVLLAASAILLVGAARRLKWRLSDVLREVGLFIYVLIATALVLRLGYRLLGGTVTARLSEARTLLAGFDGFMLGGAALAVAIAVLACVAVLRGKGGRTLALGVLAVTAGCSVHGLDWPIQAAGIAAAMIALAGFGRRRGVAGAGIGIVVVVLLLGLAAQVVAPALTPILLWPLLLGSIALALLGRGGSGPAVMLMAVLGLAFLGQFGQQALVALGFGLPEVAALPAALGLLVLYPLLASTLHPLALGERRGKRALGARSPFALGWLLVLAGGACWGVVARSPVGDARHPALSQVIHVSDADGGTDRRISTLDPLDDWSREALGAAGGVPERGELPAAFLSTIWQAGTPPVVAMPATLTLAADADGERRVLTITPPAGARELRLQMRGSVAAGDVRLNGIAVDLLATPDALDRLRLYPGGQSIELSWTAAGGSLDIRHAAISDDWPADATPLPERPSEVMPWGMSDTHIVTATTRLDW